MVDNSEYVQCLSNAPWIDSDYYERRAESPFWAGRNASLNQSQSKVYGQNTVVGASYSHANIPQSVVPSHNYFWINCSHFNIY
jgi:hypothetical protein